MYAAGAAPSVYGAQPLYDQPALGQPVGGVAPAGGSGYMGGGYSAVASHDKA